MLSERSKIGVRAFGPDTDLHVHIENASQTNALEALLRIIKENSSSALLIGPKSSGKSVVVGRLARSLRQELSVIRLDGKSQSARQIVSTLLSELNCNVKLQSMAELLKLLHVIVAHRSRVSAAPILFVENIDRMTPSSLQTLCTMSEFTTRGQSAIRIILTGRCRSRGILAAQETVALSSRTPHIIELGPLTARESVRYLHGRLAAAGIIRVDSIFPLDVCERLHDLSGGWPGLLNYFALAAIDRVYQFPVSLTNTFEKPAIAAPLTVVSATSHPVTLIISRFGKVVSEFSLEDAKTVIGRSDQADVTIDDDFVSKLHAMLLLRSGELTIVDLNSSNGTLVNSKRVTTKVLKNLDIISIGHCTVKIQNLTHTSVAVAATTGTLEDTVKMKTIAEQREQRLNTETPAASNDKKKA